MSSRLRTTALAEDTYCVAFAYYIDGRGIGELRLYTEAAEGSRDVIWNNPVEQSIYWLTYSSTITIDSAFNKVICISLLSYDCLHTHSL